jgi:hypothetical protein
LSQKGADKRQAEDGRSKIHRAVTFVIIYHISLPGGGRRAVFDLH